MRSELKPYPAYRDSGVTWLGKIPERWVCQRLRTVVDMRVSSVDKHAKDGELPVRLCNYVDVYKHDHINQSINFIPASATPEEIRQFRILSDDVLITKDSESWNDIGVPALVKEQADDLVCGYHLAILRPVRAMLSGDYLLRAIQCRPVAYQFHIEANGVTRYGLSHDAIKSIRLPLPPNPEQSAIVLYLDYMDRRIQRYIRAKQKLIKLLEEQKQAIIHQAVTGQIDVRTGKPYPAYKPSGVEWLGDVPEHWAMRRLRSLASIKTGGSDTVDRVDDGEYPFFVRSQTVEHINSWSFDGEAVLTAGDGAGVAKVFHYTSGKFDYHQRVYKFSSFRSIMGLFFYEYFRATLKFEALAGNAKSTVDSLRRPMLQNFPVVVPLPQEQAAIVGHLNDVSGSIDTTIARTRHGIMLLREYRTRLISDVVTGKLDVREAAANLPEELDEELPEDQEQEEEAEEDLLDDEQAGDEA